MRTIITILITLLVLTFSVGQTVKQLEEERKNALMRLETTSKVLSETKKTQQTSLNKLNIITKSITERKTLIKNIDKEIGVLENEMQKLNTETRKLERELETYKAEYAKMAQEAYINRSVYSKILFILSSDSFDQSFRRLRYMQEYTAYRKEQMRKIERTKLEITKKTNDLAQHKKTQVVIKNQQNLENKKLIADQKKENALYANLKQKEKALQADLQKQQRIANDLNKKIEKLIAEEIRKAEEKRRAEERAKRSKEPTDAGKKEAPKTPGTAAPDKGYELTKEEKLITGNFSANVGRLPWPVEKGFISGKFGIQPHPALKYVTTNNKGIYIQTPAKSIARSVFDGVVTQRFAVPGSNNGVIIQHGQYRTVYANLTQIHVRVGQKVNAKQNIGEIYTDTESDNKTEMFFQIWNDRTILNPEFWIAR